MKTLKQFTLFFISLLLLFTSCQNSLQNQAPLTIQFSDGSVINERNIEFYDSSTCTYFLKKSLNLNDAKEFTIRIGNDSLVGGKLHSCILSSMPPTPYFISDCFFSGPKVLTIGYLGDGDNLLNSTPITDALKNKGKFRNGLSVKINEIEVIKIGEQTDVVTSVTIQNHDPNPYLIPDVDKMGERYFTDFTGALSFFSVEGGTHSFAKDNNSDRARDEISREDLSVIEGNTSKTFSYRSRNYHPILPGKYKVYLRFGGVVYTANNFDLDQNDGRIWVGVIKATKTNVTVN